MNAFARTDMSILGRWWWTVDRWILAGLVALALAGTLLTFAASPAVAIKKHLDVYHFVERQIGFLGPAMVVLLATSLLSVTGVRRIAIVAFLVVLAGMILTLFLGAEINGARRWLTLAGHAIQPSEFVKPAFAVVTAWVFAGQVRNTGFPGYLVGLLLLLLVVALLMAEPDFGQGVLIAAVWTVQLFLAGAPLVWFLGLGGAGIAAMAAAYMSFPHVASRIDRFLDPASGDTYQADTALEAFRAGGLFGRGPGEGIVKRILPDAHSDYVFAVAGEEFGIIACLLLAGLIAFIVLRGFARLFQEQDPFVSLAAAGLLTQFGLQAIVNMGVNLNLLPSKGLTLPFVSYGGSSLLAVSFGMGMVLALTRRRANQGAPS